MSKNPLSTVEPWDLVTPGYVKELIPVFQKWTQDTIEKIALHSVALNSNDRVLDVACGPGTVTTMVAPLVKRVVALDFSPKMVHALRKIILSRGLKNVEAAICDCQCLAQPDNTFDVFISQFGLMFFSNRNKAFSEAFRVLKPLGRIAVSSWAPVTQSEAMTLMLSALGVAFPEQFGASKESRNIVKGLDDKDTFFAELTSAGFENINIDPIAHSFDVTGPEPFWSSMVESSAPIVLMKSKMTQEAWQAAAQKAIDYITTHLNGRTKLSSTAYIATAIKPHPK